MLEGKPLGGTAAPRQEASWLCTGKTSDASQTGVEVREFLSEAVRQSGPCHRHSSCLSLQVREGDPSGSGA